MRLFDHRVEKEWPVACFTDAGVFTVMDIS